jgi:hypothetical protein
LPLLGAGVLWEAPATMLCASIAASLAVTLYQFLAKSLSVASRIR